MPNAMFNPGEYFYEGKAREQDPDKASEWYRKALEAGYEPEGEEQEHADSQEKEIQTFTENLRRIIRYAQQKADIGDKLS